MSSTDTPLYRRILLKLSGEALQGDEPFGIDPSVVKRIVLEIRSLLALQVQVAMVIGGGNLFRGESLSALGINRITGDYVGMLATMMNALAFRDAFEQAGIPAHTMSAISLEGLMPAVNRHDAMHLLKQNHVVIFAGGTGNPLVTTDTAASLRAIEIEADILLKATDVDGVYTADPALDPQAQLLKRLSYSEVLAKEYKVMDLSAFSKCRDYDMPIRVFNIGREGELKACVLDTQTGTYIGN